MTRSSRSIRSPHAVALAVILIVMGCCSCSHAGAVVRPPNCTPQSSGSGPAPIAGAVGELGQTGVYGSWASLPAAPIAPRNSAAVAWTGSQMIIWGGFPTGGDDWLTAFSDGASFDPTNDQWQRLPAGPPRLGSFVWTWTGRNLMILGRSLTEELDSTEYDNATRTWCTLPPPDLNPSLANGLVWTGTRAVFAVAASDQVEQFDSYDPAADRWERLPDLHLPTGQSVSISQVNDSAGTLVMFSQSASSAALYTLAPAAPSWQQQSWYPASLTTPPGAAAECDGRMWFLGPASIQVLNLASHSVAVLARTSAGTGGSSGEWSACVRIAAGIRLLTISSAGLQVFGPGSDRTSQLVSSPMLTMLDHPAVAWTGHSLFIWGAPRHYTVDTPDAPPEKTSTGLAFTPGAR